MDLKDTRVTIVGLGLMGGSMALALRQRCGALVGIDSDIDTVELAQRLPAFDRASADLADGLDRCDLLILAMPVGAILSLLDTFRRNPPAIRFLMDIGSTKREIVRAMEKLPVPIDPIGGHPVCGKETSGLAAADPELFQNQTFVLTPLKRTSNAGLNLADQVVRTLGARPKFMEAERHDLLVATTSQLPYLLASALVRSAESLGAKDPELWELVASGFLGTSRLTLSDLTMMVDILSTNRDMTIRALDQARNEIEGISRLIASDEPQALREALRTARARRSELAAAQPPPETDPEPTHGTANHWSGT